MTLRWRFVGIALLTLFLSSCSHGFVDEIPTAPGPTTEVTLRNLVIMPPGGGTLIAGNTAPIKSSGTEFGVGAWAQYSDGSAKFIKAEWSSSDTTVIVVDNDTLRAIGRGTAVLTARAEGKTATETFRVEPNMAGSWSGTFIVDSCGAGSGSLGELICSGEPTRPRGSMAVGSAVPITLEVQKSGADLTANVAIGEFHGVLHGNDAGSNVMTLKGDLTGNRTTITIINWATQAKTDLLEGQIGFEVRIFGLPSNAAVVGHVQASRPAG